MRMRCGHCGSSAVRRDYGGFASCLSCGRPSLSARDVGGYCPRAAQRRLGRGVALPAESWPWPGVAPCSWPERRIKGLGRCDGPPFPVRRCPGPRAGRR